MHDCFIPSSGNYLAPVPVPDRAELSPERIFEKLIEFAALALDRLRRGVIACHDVVRVHGEFLINRRWARVGMAFTVINSRIVAPPRPEALRSIARQINAVNN